MIRTFEELKGMLRPECVKTVAVACAHDAHTLEAMLKLREEKLMRCILIGHKDEIRGISGELGYQVGDEELLQADTDEEAAAAAVRLVKDGSADFIQKGLLQTSTILKAVVNKETGLRTGGVISHAALVEIPGYHKLAGVTDTGMIPNPDYKTKEEIVRNAVGMFNKLGYERPLIAALCAAETVSPKIVETVDAAKLKEAASGGELGSCYVEGPISFDLAMNAESAKIKRYESPVTGQPDILLFPTLASGNIMVKSLIQFAGARMAGCVLGAKCPIALISRSASFEEKYYSLLLSAMLS